MKTSPKKESRYLYPRLAGIIGPLVVLALMLLWMPWQRHQKMSSGKDPRVVPDFQDKPSANIASQSSQFVSVLSTASRGTAIDEAFVRVGMPQSVRPFPRGPNAQRRYGAPQTTSLPPEAMDAPPVSMAMSPSDGRTVLLPEETDLHTKKSRRMVLDVGALETVVAGKTARLLAPTPEGSAITLVIRSIKSRSGMTHTLQGEVEGEPQKSVVQLVLHDGIIHGSVSRYGIDEHLEYRVLASGHMMVRELDNAAMTAECGSPGLAAESMDDSVGPPHGAPETPDDEPHEPVADTAGYTTIDVVVGYDQGARLADGGHAQMEARIIASVDRMTLAFSNSQVTATELMLLGTIEDPDYVFPGRVSGSMSTTDELGDLNNTAASNPGLNTVSDYANALGADLKAFIVRQVDGSAGIAYRPGTSSITARDYMTANRITFGHELGHNIGARHSWGDTSGSDAATNIHAYGWRLAPVGQARVRTIMAYDWAWGAGTRIPYFANPNVLFQGARTGQVDGYNATGDALSDPRYVAGGFVGGLGAGFDGTNLNLGARNAQFILSQAPGTASLRTRTAFQVITPATSASLNAGETSEIYWTGGDHTGGVSISLFKDGVFQEQIAAGITAHNRRYNWAIPSVMVSGSDYMVRVTLNGSLTADSGQFSVLGQDFTVSPNGGYAASGDAGGPLLPAQQIYTLSNTSSNSLDWTASVNAAWIDVSQTGGTLLPSSTTTVSVTLNSAALALPIGLHQAELSLTDVTSGISRIRPITLTVIGYPQISIEQPEGVPMENGVSVVDFNHVLLNATASRRFTIRNLGVESLNLGSVTLSGEQAADYSLGAVSSTSLAPGEIGALTVTFMPKANGVRQAVLSVASDDLSANPFLISLTGAGFQPDGGVQLIADINTLPGGITPTNFLSMGDYALFTATTPDHGTELWRTDGTEAGTYMIIDLNPGTANSGIIGLTRAGDVAYFSATDGVAGNEPWVTDGTSVGTRMVLDLSAGSGSSAPGSFAVLGSQVFFAASTTATGRELWKTDGSAAGTVLVADLFTGTTGSSPVNLMVFQEKLYFSASGSFGGLELYRSDGTTGGTVLLMDINQGSASSSPANFVSVGGTLFFTATTATFGLELWKTDGTSFGTVMVRDINPGTANAIPGALVAMNDVLYFRATTASNGNELWRSDGTEGGTTLVRDIFVGPSSGMNSAPVLFNDKLYMAASDGTFGTELWTSDGTSQGTVLVRDIYSDSNSSGPTNFRVVDNRLFFTAFDDEGGRELWATDGTTNGTQRVRDIHPGTNSSNPSQLVDMNGLLIFACNDGGIGQELWRSDGTRIGTYAIGDFLPGSGSSNPSTLTNVNGSLFFAANNTITGTELWQGSVTPAGASLVRDIVAGSSSSSPSNITPLANQFVFTAFESATNLELYVSNGTNAGTRLLRDIRTGNLASSPSGFLRVGEQVFFSADDGVNGRELWRTDGTAGGTRMVKDINLGLAASNPIHFVNYKRILYFRATDAATGSELWRSDGTEVGTWRVKDLRAGTNSSSPLSFAVMDGLLYFSAFSTEDGYELWRSDGTEDGTLQVASIVPGATSATPSNLVAIGTTLYFSATNTDGIELWKFDSMTQAVAQVKDILAGPGSSSPSLLRGSGGYLFFTADDGINGRELWRSDGTLEGTLMLKDILPGASGSNPVALVNMGGVLYFSANDGSRGEELWRTDGTQAGTELVTDLYPGSISSAPGGLTSVGPQLYFTAFTEGNGRELFRVDENRPANLVVSLPAHNALVGGISTVDLGATALGSTTTRTFTLSNSGTQPVTFSGVQLSGPNAAQFSVGSFSQERLFGNDVATLDIQFTPIGNGSKTATLTIFSDDPSAPAFNVTLVGEGGIDPVLSVEHPVGTALPMNGAVIDFGETTMGGAAESREVHVSNQLAGSQLDLLSVSITGPHAGDFLLDRSLLPNSILGGLQFSFTIAFQALAPGRRTAELTVVSNDPQRSTFVIDLVGEASVVAGPAQRVFGPHSLPPRWVDEGAFDLPFASTSGLPVEIEIVAGSGAGTLDGSTFIPSSVGGAVTFRITQSGGAGFDAAPPMYRSLVIGAGRFIKIAQGSRANHSAGLKADGTLWTWGSNSSGQLGLGHTNFTSVPTQVGMDTDWADIVLGSSHTLALKTDGSLWAWGSNLSGQLGFGDTVQRNIPVNVLPGSVWLSLAAGQSHSLAISNNGSLWGWGLNSSYQLGLGTLVAQLAPTQIGVGTTWARVAAGSMHSAAIQNNGSLWVWGSNINGRLGTGDTTQRTLPTQISAGVIWQQIACGNDFTFAIRNNGSLWAWGNNIDYQLGLGDTTSRNIPTQVGAALNWSAIVPGSTHGLALKSDGTLWGWGRTTSIGRIPLGTSWAVSSPTQIGTARDWTGASSGVNHTLAMKQDGTLYSAGLNDNGQLAAPLIQSTRIASGGVLDFSVGSWRTHFIRADGSLWAVGSNIRDLGDGTTIPRRQPIRIGEETDWTRLAGGSNYVFALRGEGTLWACGLGQDGRLGDGTSTDRLSFVQVGTDATWRHISAGNGHSVGIKADGTLWTWGFNSSGQLGHNDTISRNIPTQMGVGTDWAFVACTNNATYAIKTDGSLWAWGNNFNGRLGLGDAINRVVPVRVGMDNDWVSVSAGNIHTLALKNDGSLWAVGNNSSGQLGLGDSVSRNLFERVGSATDWKEISAIHDHSLAIKSDGTLWGWGLNTSNQLGNGTGQNSSQPIRIGNSNAWTRLATGTSSSFFSLAATEDGSLWGFGANTDAQLTESVPLNSLLNLAHPSTSVQLLSFEPVLVSDFGVPLPLRLSTMSGLPPALAVIGPAALNAEGTHITIHGPGEVKLLAWQKGDYPVWAGTLLTQVDFVYKPVILSPPASQVVSQFDGVTFSVTAESSAAMTYQWRRNGVPLQDARESTLMIDSVMTQQAGNYDVVVTNAAGSTTSTAAVLSVAAGTPFIAMPPAHQMLRPGDPLQLAVLARGTPPLKYQWRRNGRAIPGATASIFELEDVTVAAAGGYTVSVTSQKTVTSAVAHVTVVPEAFETLISKSGGIATLRSADIGQVTARQWTFNGAPLAAGSRHRLSRDRRSLVIRNLETTDAGMYRCEVTAPGGGLMGGAVELVVTTAPPSLVVPLNLSDGIVGGLYGYQIQTASNPSAVATRYGASGLPVGVSVDSQTGFISGYPVRAGLFNITVTASNGNGTARTTETIEVYPVPLNMDGQYTGLIERHAVVNNDLGGRFDFKVEKTGACSGRLTIGRVQHPFRGSVRVDITGATLPRATIAVQRPGKPAPPPYLLNFELQPQQGEMRHGASLALGTELAGIQGWRQNWHARNQPALTRVGYYTLVLEPEATHLGQADIPQGHGFASFTINTAGTLKLGGKLADGTAITLNTFIGPDGQTAVYHALYAKDALGSILGRVDVGLGVDPVQTGDNQLSGRLNWSRPASSAQAYGAGFDRVELEVIGGAFTEPPTLLDVTPLINNVRLRFFGGGLEASATNPDFTFTVGLENRVTIVSMGNPGLATFKPIPAKGWFSGHFNLVDPHWDMPAPATWLRRPSYQGIIIQSEGDYHGVGYFLLPALPVANPKTNPPEIMSGRVIFEKTP